MSEVSCAVERARGREDPAPDALDADARPPEFLRGNHVLFRWPAPSRVGTPMSMPEDPSQMKARTS